MNGNVTSSSHQTPTMDSLFEPFSKANLWISNPKKRKQKLYVQQKVCQDVYSVELPWIESMVGLDGKVCTKIEGKKSCWPPNWIPFGNMVEGRRC